MPTLTRLLGFSIGLAVLAACGDDTIRDTEWQAELNGLNGEEDINGAAVVRWRDGDSEFNASAGVNGDEPGAIRPWRMHFGTCEERGDVVGADDEYPNIVVTGGGIGNASVTIDESLDPQQAYHIVIYRSEGELEPVACGNLDLQTQVETQL